MCVQIVFFSFFKYSRSKTELRQDCFLLIRIKMISSSSSRRVGNKHDEDAIVQKNDVRTKRVCCLFRADDRSSRFTSACLNLSKTRRRKKLILHFDVNETIMVGDPAGGDTFSDSLNKIIAKKALVRRDEEVREGTFASWRWQNGEALSEATCSSSHVLDVKWTKPKGFESFYRLGHTHEAFKRHCKTFTEDSSPGRVFRPIFERLEKTLRIDSTDEPFCHDGAHHFLLPAFFNTLAELERRGRTFCVVIRTFGTDGTNVARAINAWADGKHPLYQGQLFPSFRIDLSKDVYVGRYDRERAKNGNAPFVATRQEDLDTTSLPAKSVLREEDVVDMINSDERRVLVIQDDYYFWRDNGYVPSCGKPLWIDWDQQHVHQIFFDDNIHNISDDSIVSIRLRRDASESDRSYHALSGESIRRLHGTFLVQVPTHEAILDRRWFLRNIEDCEVNYSALRVSHALQREIFGFE